MCNAIFIKPSYIRSLYSAVLKKCPRFGMYGFLAFSDYHYHTITLYLCSVVLHNVVLHNSALFKNLMWYLQLTNLHQRRRFFFVQSFLRHVTQIRNLPLFFSVLCKIILFLLNLIEIKIPYLPQNKFAKISDKMQMNSDP